MTVKQATKKLKESYPELSDELLQHLALTFIHAARAWEPFCVFVNDQVTNLRELSKKADHHGDAPVIIKIADHLEKWKK